MNNLDINKASFCTFLSCLAYVPKTSIIDDVAKTLGYAVIYLQNENFGFIFYNDKEVYISFRGTLRAQDFITDLDSILIKRQEYGLIHKGFGDAWNRLQDKLEDVMKNNPDLFANKELYIAGHSLGSAIATLCSYYLSLKSIPITAVYTIGQPRIGNWRWLRNYNKLKINHFRIINNQDLVTKVPGIWFYHVGTPVFINAIGEIVKSDPRGWKKWFLIPFKLGLTDHESTKEYLVNLSKNLTMPFLEGKADAVIEELKKL